MSDEKKTEATPTEQETLGFQENDIAKDLRAAFEEADNAESKEDEEVIEATSEEEVVEESDGEEEVSEEPAQEDDDAGEDEGVEEEPLVAPHSWNADSKKIFEELPRAAQEIVLQRETERDRFLTQKGEEAATLKRRYNEVENILDEYVPEGADLYGQSDAQVLRQALAMRQELLGNPAGFIQWAAGQAGLDLSKVSEANGQVDPTTAALVQNQQALQAQLAQQQQAQAERTQSLLEQEVVNFAKETDGGGNAMRPHFEAVWQDMMPLVQHIRDSNPGKPNQEVLQEAYERAVWANPQTREVEQKRAISATEAKRAKETKKKASKAKRAGKSITGAPGGSSQPAQPEDLRGVLEQAFEQYT